jgi:hypothetical protein
MHAEELKEQGRNDDRVVSTDNRIWEIDLLSIDYAFRPRLRPRLTLSGRTFLRNP